MVRELTGEVSELKSGGNLMQETKAILLKQIIIIIVKAFEYLKPNTEGEEKLQKQQGC